MPRHRLHLHSASTLSRPCDQLSPVSIPPVRRPVLPAPAFRLRFPPRPPGPVTSGHPGPSCCLPTRDCPDREHSAERPFISLGRPSAPPRISVGRGQPHHRDIKARYSGPSARTASRLPGTRRPGTLRSLEIARNEARAAPLNRLRPFPSCSPRRRRYLAPGIAGSRLRGELQGSDVQATTSHARNTSIAKANGAGLDEEETIRNLEAAESA